MSMWVRRREKSYLTFTAAPARSRRSSHRWRRKVVGVEIVGEAVEAARENAARNGLGNCEFLAGDVLKVVDELEEKPDLIVLDPPRDGIHPKAIGKILKFWRQPHGLCVLQTNQPCEGSGTDPGGRISGG